MKLLISILLTIPYEYKLSRVQKQTKAISNIEGRFRILNKKNALGFSIRKSHALVELSEITEKEYRKISKGKARKIGIK